MFEFITAPLVVGIIAIAVYKLFELFARRKERMFLIDKCSERADFTMPKMDTEIRLPKLSFSFGALKVGLLFIGIGLGLLFAFVITMTTFGSGMSLPEGIYNNYVVISNLYGASVLFFGGLGLVAAFLIELRLKKEKRPND